MKNISLIVLFCTISIITFAQTSEWMKYLDLHKDAINLYNEGKYNESKDLFEEMYQINNKFYFENDLYKYICCLAISKDSIKIAPFLFILGEKKWFEPKSIDHPLFYQFHNQSFWGKFDSIIKSKPQKNYVMMDALRKMKILDQNVRNNRTKIRKDSTLSKLEKDSLLSLPLNTMSYVDSINLQGLKRLIQENGFPSWENVGLQGVHDAWLIAQHSPPEFQEPYLEKYKMLVKENNSDITNYAYLVDRVRSRKRIPQLYGTQMYSGGEYQPIEDVSDLNNRREKVLLPPLDMSKIKVLEQFRH